jgi:phage tail sheath protein FI
MATLLHPGVYVSEVPSGTRSIEGAATSTAIFVGETERGPLGPVKITSRSDYERLFGGYFRLRDLTSPGPDPTKVLTAYACDGFYQNGGSTAYVLRAMDAPVTGAVSASRGPVEASSPGLWGNSVSVAFLAASRGSGAGRFRIAVVYEFPSTGERELVEVWDRLSVKRVDENYVADVLMRSQYVRWREDAVLAIPDLDDLGSPASTDPDRSSIIDEAPELTGGLGGGGELTSAQYGELLDELAGVDDAALLLATCDALLDGAPEYTDFVDQFIGYANNRRPRQDLFFVGDLPRHSETGNPGDGTTKALKSYRGLNTSNFAGLFWPHLVVSDIAGVGRNPMITVPPAGHVAGVFARTDGVRGVWKAPAGTESALNGTLSIELQLNDLHSDSLNPEGLNALRQIPGAGRVIWGSRTMQPSSEWRYISVRRTAIFLRTSIYNGIQWAVFEPNDKPLWDSLHATISGFMETQFRKGAFAGLTSKDAYLVKVDAETTTPIDQAAGVVNILVAFAPVRPAEFVVVQLSQKTQPVA